jgi:hypothetical protein
VSAQHTANADGSVPMAAFCDVRPVVIEAAAHHLGNRGQCSACHGPAPRGVVLYTGVPGRVFDPKVVPHSFLCIECSARIAIAVAADVGALA